MSESVDLALSGGTYLNSRTMPHLPAAFSEKGSNPLFGTQKITSEPLGGLRDLISECVYLPLPGGRNLNPRTIPHLPDLYSEEDRNPLLKTKQITAAPLWAITEPNRRKCRLVTFRR